jgi:anti-sigma B factor antagonist
MAIFGGQFVIDFSVEIDNKNSLPIIRVKGEIDVYTCTKLNTSLQEVIQTGAKTIVLNLENIQYIDSTGLGTIAHAAREVQHAEGKILVVCPKPQVRKIFEISGLTSKNIVLFDDEPRALGAKNG